MYYKQYQKISNNITGKKSRISPKPRNRVSVVNITVNCESEKETRFLGFFQGAIAFVRLKSLLQTNFLLGDRILVGDDFIKQLFFLHSKCYSPKTICKALPSASLSVSCSCPSFLTTSPFSTVAIMALITEGFSNPASFQ